MANNSAARQCKLGSGPIDFRFAALFTIQKLIGDMSDLFWLTDAQMACLAPFFPNSHGKLRIDDRRVFSGIISLNFNGLRWRHAPPAFGPHKTLYNQWKWWSDTSIKAERRLVVEPSIIGRKSFAPCPAKKACHQNAD